MTKKLIKRALVSVYDKTGLIEIGNALQSAGVEILSTGSTAATLRGSGINVIDVSTYTEMILGLPHETYQTWCRGLTDLLEMGQHNRACRI